MDYFYRIFCGMNKLDRLFFYLNNLRNIFNFNKSIQDSESDLFEYDSDRPRANCIRYTKYTIVYKQGQNKDFDPDEEIDFEEFKKDMIFHSNRILPDKFKKKLKKAKFKLKNKQLRGSTLPLIEEHKETDFLTI